MPGPKSPPPGSIPSPMMSPDVQSMMGQFQAAQAGKSGSSQTPLPPSQSSSSGPMPTQQKTARDVGTLPDEAGRFVSDAKDQLLSAVPDVLQELFHIKTTDTPEEKAKKREQLKRWNEMTDAERMAAQQIAEERAARQKKLEEERIEKQKMDEQESTDLPVIQGKSRAEGGAGQSNKQKSNTMVQSNRTKPKKVG